MANLLKINEILKNSVHKSLEIRTMQKIDLPTVMDIEHSIQASPWTQLMWLDSTEKSDICWILVRNKALRPNGRSISVCGEIIGFIAFSLCADECNILNIGIKRKKQGKGYGTALLQAAIEYAKQYDVNKIWLEVRASNQAAIRLYQKLGFTEIDIRKNYYSALNLTDSEDAAIYCYSCKQIPQKT
ncbi:MAG: ribosomal protein S18-alanine N-acetyltransferase [Gammaproteobacteria bacterium]|nr:ribosomal protein S18-alanine N-acetyltransferase [Gammaproteobacteria bacterium]